VGTRVGTRAAPPQRISPSSASILPQSFANNAAATQWVERLRSHAIIKGQWARSCKPGCSRLSVYLSVVPGARDVGASSIGDARPVVAIIEPVKGQPANKHTDDPYQIETGNFTYLVYVEGSAQQAGQLVWHIQKIPFSEHNGARTYDWGASETIGGFHYDTCPGTHQPGSDAAAFQDCPPAGAHGGAQADTQRLLMRGALAAQDSSPRPSDPKTPLWVSCLDGCCTASGT
jgi:hypothetical protein